MASEEVQDPSSAGLPQETELTTEQMVEMLRENKRKRLNKNRRKRLNKNPETTESVVTEKVDHPLKEKVEEMIRDYTEGSSFVALLEITKSLSKENEKLLRQLQTPVKSQQTPVKPQKTPAQPLVEVTPEETQQREGENEQIFDIREKDRGEELQSLKQTNRLICYLLPEKLTLK